MKRDARMARLDALLAHARNMDRSTTLVDLAPILSALASQAGAIAALRDWIATTVPDVAVDPAYTKMTTSLESAFRETAEAIDRFASDKAAQE